MSIRVCAPAKATGPKVSPANLQALQVFRKFERDRGRGPTQGELAQRLGKDRSTARQHCDYFLMRGLIETVENVNFAKYRVSHAGKLVLRRAAKAKKQAATEAGEAVAA